MLENLTSGSKVPVVTKGHKVSNIDVANMEMFKTAEDRSEQCSRKPETQRQHPPQGPSAHADGQRP